MSRRSVTAIEVLEIMGNIWATTKDVQKLGAIGQGKALNIMEEIRIQMKNDNMFVPRNKVSMDYVIKYFNIDESKMRRRASVGSTVETG